MRSLNTPTHPSTLSRNRALICAAVLLFATSPQLVGQQTLTGGTPFVIENGGFEFTSEWIEIEQPLITTASAEVSISAAQPTAANGENLRIVIEVENGRPVTLVDVQPDQSWYPETPVLRTALGALAQTSLAATRARFVIEATSASEATRIEINGLGFEETGRPLEEAIREASAPSIEFFASLIDPETDENEYFMEFEDLDKRGSITFKVRYGGYVNPIDPGTLGDDDICFEAQETFDVVPEITFLGASEEQDGSLLATYSLLRPDEGWGALESIGTLEVSTCFGGVRSTSGNRQTQQIGQFILGPPAWEDIMPSVYDRNAPTREKFIGPYTLDSLDQPFIDISFSVNASRVPVGDLGTGDLMLIVDVELYPAELVATGEVDQGFYDVTYRFAQPPGGWPYFRSTVALSPEFRAPPRPLQPGALPERLFQTITMIERPLAPGPSIIPLMDYGSADALSADSFELEIHFVSENGVDVESIGDGDLYLRHERRPAGSRQDGKLVRTEIRDEGKRVAAFFEFNRDPNAVFSGSWINVHSPRGAVADLAGNITPGGIASTFDFAGATNLSRTPRRSYRQQENLPTGEFEFGFIPLSPYRLSLEEFHFRVVYRSALPIDLEDFVSHPHLTGETQALGQNAQERLPDLFPEMVRWRSSEDGRFVEADYVIERPEWGWPRSVILALNQHAIRDIENRTPVVPEGLALGIPIADIGGNTDDAIRVTVLGGHEVSADAESHQISVFLDANERLQAEEFADSLIWFGWHPELLPAFEDFDSQPFPTPGRLVSFVNVSDEEVIDYDLHVFEGGTIEQLPETGSADYYLLITDETIHFRAFAYDGRLLVDRTEGKTLADDLLLSPEALSGKTKLSELDKLARSVLSILARLDLADGGLTGNLAVATYEVERPAEGWEAWDIDRLPFVLQVPATTFRLTRIAGSEPAVGFVDILNTAVPLPLLQGFEDWIRELEQQSGLPAQELKRDEDGDGQSGVLEYALGSNPADGSDTANLSPTIVAADGQSFMSLIVPVRASAYGVSVEIQSSVDGKQWQSIGDSFEVVERTASSTPGVDHLLLKSKAPIDPADATRLFRVAVVR